MKQKLYVPIMGSNITPENRTEYLIELQKMQADAVFIAADRAFFFADDRARALENIGEHMAFFREAGLECGLWIQAFGFGDSVPLRYREKAARYTRLRSVTGREAQGDAMCPECEAFMDDYCRWVRECARLHPDYLMLDDDLCLSVRPGLGCFCDKHMQLLSEELGEALDLNTLPDMMFSGKSNRYRDAWLRVMGDTLRRFCHRVREAIDSVDERIRAGFCAGYTSWDIEGADAEELTRILAGQTRPFLRLTGAPYWVTQTMPRFRGHRLNEVIESTRMQEAWLRDSDIEVFNENDSYPRPRAVTPASLIECFDASLRASGSKGSLKYVFDYYADIDEERGYAQRHVRNLPLYEFIERHFTDKMDAGVWVIQPRRKIGRMTLPAPFAGEGRVMQTFFSPAAALLTSHGIPTRYDGGDCAIAFGENALALDQLPSRLILDLPAARILAERGVDTGLASAERAGIPLYERFGDKKIRLLYAPEGDYYRCSLKPGASVLSRFEGEDGEEFPSAYRYCCGQTELLVYAFDAETINFSSILFQSRRRRLQLQSFVIAPAWIEEGPWVYALCRQSGNETAVLMINLAEDELTDASIRLDRRYHQVQCMGAQGRLEGDQFVLTGCVPPFGLVAAVFSGADAIKE